MLHFFQFWIKCWKTNTYRHRPSKGKWFDSAGEENKVELFCQIMLTIIQQTLIICQAPKCHPEVCHKLKPRFYQRNPARSVNPCSVVAPPPFMVGCFCLWCSFGDGFTMSFCPSPTQPFDVLTTTTVQFYVDGPVLSNLASQSSI